MDSLPGHAAAGAAESWRDDPRWALAERVAGSAAFQRSWRLRALLLFLCERALRDPQAPIREEEIGAAVFGRGADFDTSLDTLVRVQVSQLRKKLQLHFAADAASVVAMIVRGPRRFGSR